MYPSSRRSPIALVLALLVRAALGWADDFPPELVRFVPYEGNPVFTGAGPGHWDEQIRERGWILREGETYHLWYTGYVQRIGPMMLGHATSPDGIHWTRDARNPIHDADWVEDMMVVRDGPRLLMFAEGRGDQAHLLTSGDGIRWHRESALDVRLANGKPIPPGPYGTPTVFKQGETWNLFYERRDQGIWRARSTDLKIWTNVSDEPVLLPGPEAYDGRMIAMNQVIEHEGAYFAYYHGRGEEPDRWCSCVARSDDLQTWRKYPGNPLFPSAENKSSPIVVSDGKSFRLYTMHSRVELHLPAESTP